LDATRIEQVMAMLRVLVPVDGSRASKRALRYAAKRHRGSPGACLMLLNVQPAVVPSALVSTEIVRNHQARMAERILAPAQRVCRRLGIEYRATFLEGDAAESIASFARQTRCKEIVIGTRGLGRISGLMLGSVATKVVHLASVPVTLVK
jgi:nucleotide-binding universal stress UspA family protein